MDVRRKRAMPTQAEVSDLQPFVFFFKNICDAVLPNETSEISARHSDVPNNV